MSKKQHQKRVYAAITKTEKQDDGTLKVYGYASSGAVDSDGEIITSDAMKAAIPDYMKFGAVREMHQPMAAGTALSASVDDAGKTEFSCHVVDPVAVLKVETGTYKGFSIGGKVTKRNATDKTIIEGLNLVEVSLVDRPANPEALFTMYKAEKTDEDHLDTIADALDSGSVTPAQIAKAVATLLEKSTSETQAEADKEKATEVPVEETPVAKADVVQKGMYTVANFASVLSTIAYIFSDCQSEAEWEGDSSPVPGKLKEWLKAGAALMMEMTQEELDELTGTGKATKAFQVLDIQKKGATFSAKTQAVLGDVHKMLQDGCDKMSGLGYKQDDDADSAASVTDTKGEGGADKTAAATPSDTNGIVHTTELDAAIEKALSVKIAPLNEALQKAEKENTDLKAKVEELSKRAAPGKALLHNLNTMAVSKAADYATEAVKAEVIPEAGTPARAQYEMRKVFATGGTRLG